MIQALRPPPPKDLFISCSFPRRLTASFSPDPIGCCVAIFSSMRSVVQCSPRVSFPLLCVVVTAFSRPCPVLLWSPSPLPRRVAPILPPLCGPSALCYQALACPVVLVVLCRRVGFERVVSPGELLPSSPPILRISAAHCLSRARHPNFHTHQGSLGQNDPSQAPYHNPRCGSL